MDRVLGGSEYEHRAAVERSRASARASLEADGQRGILEDYHPEDVRQAFFFFFFFFFFFWMWVCSA